MASEVEKPLLALDAMGVLYESGDDVAELLVPFVKRKGSKVSPDAVERAYLAASLGQIDAETFWQRMGLHPDVEEEYLAGHRLASGALDLLENARKVFGGVCCISNDVSQWSAKLRRSFGISDVISPWIISGDIGVRKPSAGIYTRAIVALGTPPRRIVFVDDRLKNLDTAKRLGMRTVHFGTTPPTPKLTHTSISRLSQVLDL